MVVGDNFIISASVSLRIFSYSHFTYAILKVNTANLPRIIIKHKKYPEISFLRVPGNSGNRGCIDL